MADKTTPKPRRKPSPVKNGYLILYNAVSAVLWLTVLGRVVGVNVVRGPHFAYLSVGEFCKWTQTLAGMEVLHSIFGKQALSHLHLKCINSTTGVCLSVLSRSSMGRSRAWPVEAKSRAETYNNTPRILDRPPPPPPRRTKHPQRGEWAILTPVFLC